LSLWFLCPSLCDWFTLPALHLDLQQTKLWYCHHRVLVRSKAFSRCLHIVAQSAYYILHICPSVRLSSCTSVAIIGQISIKLDRGNFMKISRENAKLATMYLNS
jgi:hypothetical protein